MRTIVINQYNNYITDEKIIQKIENLLKNGYGSITCGNLTASYESQEIVDGDRIVYVYVEVIK